MRVFGCNFAVDIFCAVKFLNCIMEKFSNWRDKGTGIAPFVPQSYPKLTLKFPLQLLVLVIKLPFFLIIFPLILLNFYPIKQFAVKFLFNFKFQSPKFEKNDFIITNYSSPLTLFLTNGILLIPDSNGVLFQYSSLQFLCHAFGSDIKGKEVTDISKFKGKTVFCFIEGTSTNNKAVLKFIPLNAKYVFDGFKLKSLIIKIQPGHFNLPLPASSIGFFYHLLINGPSNIITKLVTHMKFDLDLSKTAFKNTNLHPVNLTVSDKQEFYRYYLNRK